MGIILGGLGPKVVHEEHVAPWGPRRGPLKEKKRVNFKNLLLQIQKQYRLDFVHVDTCIYEEYSLFMARPKMAPLGL